MVISKTRVTNTWINKVKDRTALNTSNQTPVFFLKFSFPSVNVILHLNEFSLEDGLILCAGGRELELLIYAIAYIQSVLCSRFTACMSIDLKSSKSSENLLSE